MRKVRSEFLNVDLDLKSRADPAPLLRALGRHVLSVQVDNTDRQHWFRLMLARQPKNPCDAIRGYARLMAELPREERVIWRHATKELEIGVRGRLEPPIEWVLEPAIVEAAAMMGAQLRFTVHSPQRINDADERRARPRRTRARRH